MVTDKAKAEAEQAKYDRQIEMKKVTPSLTLPLNLTPPRTLTLTKTLTL